MTKIKIENFSNLNLLDKKDFYVKVYDYLVNKNIGFVFLENGRMITREMCMHYINLKNTHSV